MLLTAIVWVAPAAPEAVAGEPGEGVAIPAHEARYQVLRKGSEIGHIHTALDRRDDGVWHYVTESEATATMARVLGISAEESAHFLWRDGAVVPLTYHYVSRGPSGTRYWQHRMDWDAGVSETRTHKGELEIPLEPGVLDPLTLRLEMAARLHHADARRRNHDLRVIERDELEDQEVRHRSRESVQVPAGCFDSLRMYRFRREGSSRNYDAWFARDFHWLPVRMVHYEDGEPELDIRLAEASGLPETAAECDDSEG